MDSANEDASAPGAPESGDSANAGCPHTQWTLLIDPIRRKSPGYEAALNKLLELYRPPIVGYLRCRLKDPDSSEDIAHDFIAQLLNADAFSGVERAKGRFRSFLYASLRNFLYNHIRHQNAQKRGGGAVVVSLELTGDVHPAADSGMPTEFDREWAWRIMDRAIAAVERKYLDRGSGQRFADLKGFLPGGKSATGRVELAARWGVPVNSVDKAVFDLRSRVNLAVRAYVAETVEHPDQVGEEIRFLISALDC
jgi:RNA polymerase sigma-70 factor (ECF subfamily)